MEFTSSDYRSWEIANKLLSAGLSIDPAVEIPTAAEFKFIKIYKNLPAIEPMVILKQNLRIFPLNTL